MNTRPGIQKDYIKIWSKETESKSKKMYWPELKCSRQNRGSPQLSAQAASGVSQSGSRFLELPGSRLVSMDGFGPLLPRKKPF